MLIAVTGASGSIGKAAVPKLLENTKNHCRLLFRNSPVNRKLIKKLKKSCGDRVSIVLGDITQPESCRELVKGADYVLHLAALIPPKADRDEKKTWETNYGGTVNMIDAVVKDGNTAKLIFFSTVAVYGHRGEKHPWGRVGDPLLPSVFDAYGASKLRAERYLLESSLKSWVILRETGVLYDNMMKNNIGDGLLFQTPVNVLIEWVTANDTARLLDSIISAGNKKESFWNQVYNIGGGLSCRETGFETYDNGFRLIGSSAKKFFEPRWHNQRNFHCFWFSDSHVLEELFPFQTESCEEFWKGFARKHRLYRLGRLIPAGLIKALVLKPLLKNRNAPAFWVADNIEAKVAAAYGSRKQYEQIPNTWDHIDLICEREDYNARKLHKPEYDLSHGYDESKPDSELDLADMRQAAAFRGGKLISVRMTRGDLRSKLKWQCHNGHLFESSPYTILKAGHWCPVCCSPETEWRFDELAKHIPFFAQAWYDSHAENEDLVYTIGKDRQTHVKKLSNRIV